MTDCNTIIYVFLLFTRFNENIIIDPGHVDIYPASRIPKKLHHLVRPIYRNSSGTFTESLQQGIRNEKGFRLVTHPNNLCSILQWASCDEVESPTYTEIRSIVGLESLGYTWIGAIFLSFFFFLLFSLIRNIFAIY